jgi:hypothetical protein
MTWIANVLILMGMICNGKKWRLCFILSGVGESIWTVCAAAEGRYDLASICAVFCLMCVLNYRQWGRDDEAARSDTGGNDRQR